MKKPVSPLREKFHQMLSKVARTPDTDRVHFLQEFSELLKETEVEKDADINIMCRLWIADIYERSGEVGLASTHYMNILSELEFDSPHYLTALLIFAKLKAKSSLDNALIEYIKAYLKSVDETNISAMALLAFYVNHATTEQIVEVIPLIKGFHDIMGANYNPDVDAKSQLLTLELLNSEANRKLMEVIIKWSTTSDVIEKNAILDAYINCEKLEYYQKIARQYKQS